MRNDTWRMDIYDNELDSNSVVAFVFFCTNFTQQELR